MKERPLCPILAQGPLSFRLAEWLPMAADAIESPFFLPGLMLWSIWRCTNGRRLALPGREVVSMVTYSELFAYSLVLIGVATLVLQFCKRK